MRAICRAYVIAIAWGVTGQLYAADAVYPGTAWQQADPSDVGLDKNRLEKARDFALTGGGAGYITRGGKLVMSWGDVTKRYDLKSTTKSIGVAALEFAVLDGKMQLT